MWCTGMWSLNWDQSGQWSSLSMTSQWPLIMTSQWVKWCYTRDVHFEITMDNDVARDIRCDVTMSNDIAMVIYQCITMHNDIAINIFYYVFSALCLIVLFYYGEYGIKTRTSSCLIGLDWRTHSLVLCKAISIVLWTHEISLHKHNLCVLPRLIKHSPVLVIVIYVTKYIQYIYV